MAPILHTVIVSASPKYHKPYLAPADAVAHGAGMGNEEKNGGPNHLRAWREFKKLSQDELADAVGTTQSQIAHLEGGERALSAKWLRKLADALKTTPGHLLDHDPTTLPTDIVEIWLTASPDQRRQLIEMAKVIVRNTA